MVRILEIINLVDDDEDDDDDENEDDEDEDINCFEQAKKKKRTLAAVMRANDDGNEKFIDEDDDDEDDDDDDDDFRLGSNGTDNEDEDDDDCGDDERPKKWTKVASTASSSSSSAFANRESPRRKERAAAASPPLRHFPMEGDVVVGRKEIPTATTMTAMGTSHANARGNPVATKKLNDFWVKKADDSSVQDDDDFEKACMLSSEENERSKKNEEADIDEATKRSLEDSKTFIHSGSEAMPLCRLLSRHEFKVAIEQFIHKNGGYEGIEGGQLIKHGNCNDMNKSCIADGGGRNQTGAEYGRYSIPALFRVFDVLEGKADVFVSGGKGADEIDPELGVNDRLDGLPGAKITAFVDIGHGMGIQVLQAGWSHGVRARGVELMKGRHHVAVQLMEGMIRDLLKDDPPDSTAVVLKNDDFSHAFVPDAETRCRDEALRSFLLFAEPSIPMEVQRGLVIFINNAEEVFGSRSNQNAKGQDLDSSLARLFANMQVGGRMVTLTDISCNLTQSTEWFRRDVFESGTDAVSWGNQNKSVNVYVLTKLDDYWYCQNEKCQHKKSHNLPAKNAVVDEDGEPIEKCVWCEERARPCSRLRKSTAAAAAKAQSRKNSGKRKSDSDSSS